MATFNEYGGYLPLETRRTAAYHPQALYFNSARNALRHLIRQHDIQRIALPWFTCPVVWYAVREMGCHIDFYDLDAEMHPDLTAIAPDSYVVCNDYFGIRHDNIAALTRHYPRLIVDNAQAFFSRNQGLAAINSPRKFFGMPDGGLLIGGTTPDDRYAALETDRSWQRCTHLLKRHDTGAAAAYNDFCAADRDLDDAPVQQMSGLSRALLSGVDYAAVQQQRRENYQYLHAKLGGINQLDATLPDAAVPMVYPLMIDNPGLKARLIARKIYVATYWPQLETVCPPRSNALFFRDRLVPLPIDQRYDLQAMQAMLAIIENVL